METAEHYIYLTALSVTTNPTQAQAWLSDAGWPVPTMADDAGNHAAEAFGLSAFPYYVAVDAEGRVVARASGELTIENVEALVAVAGGV